MKALNETMEIPSVTVTKVLSSIAIYNNPSPGEPTKIESTYAVATYSGVDSAGKNVSLPSDVNVNDTMILELDHVIKDHAGKDLKVSDLLTTLNNLAKHLKEHTHEKELASSENDELSSTEHEVI